MERLAISIVVALLTLMGHVEAADIHVLITTALKPAIDELAPQFERTSGHKLFITYGASGNLVKRLLDGEKADLVILADSSLEELVKRGKVLPGRTDVARTGIGVAVRKGAPKPDISSADALRRALLNAKAVAYVDPAGGGTSATPILKMFEKLGIASEIAAKARLAAGGPDGRVSTIVESGDAEIGLQQVAELLSNPGVDVVGMLPADLQQITVYSAGIASGTNAADGAKALIRFLTAPAAAPLYKSKGLEPM